MRRSAGWLFILWQMFVLNILIPGHTRGAMTMPGGKSSCCCEAEKPSCCSVLGAPSKDKAPTEDQKNRCAICSFAMGHTVATVFIITLDFSGKAFDRPITIAPQRSIVPCILPFYPVGPPEWI